MRARSYFWFEFRGLIVRPVDLIHLDIVCGVGPCCLLRTRRDFPPYDHEASSLDGRRYSSEECAEAASFILHIYVSMFPVDGMSCAHVDTEAAGNNALVDT